MGRRKQDTQFANLAQKSADDILSTMKKPKTKEDIKVKMKEKTQSTKKFYTISTMIFKTRKEAEAKLLEFENAHGLRTGSKIFEVTKVYQPTVKKVVQLTEFDMDEYIIERELDDEVPF